jgi:hypothetical protein
VIFGLFALLGITGQAWTADSGKTEWERTIEAARKEGQVNVYIGGWGAVLESGVFEQSYPGIKVVAVAGRGGETAKRILAERRAGKFIADVSSEGVGSNYRTLHAANSFDPIKPVLLLPEGNAAQSVLRDLDQVSGARRPWKPRSRCFSHRRKDAPFTVASGSELLVSGQSSKFKVSDVQTQGGK